jgi:hypothetical protein
MEQNFTKALATPARANAPTDTNGTVILMDLSTTAEHIASENRIVLNAGGGMDLRSSVARSIWVKAGMPIVATPVTGAMIGAARKSIGGHYLRHALLTVFTHSDMAIPISLRKSDTVTPAAFGAIPAAAVNPFLAAADVVNEQLTEDENLAAEFLPSGHFGSLAVVACAIHREQAKGHNWFSDTTPKSNTAGGKALGIAGADVDAFADFMADFGHDLWHLISDATLPSVAAAMTGHTVVKLTADVTYGGGAYVRGTAVDKMFRLDDAAKDRYPPSALGRAAAILGQRVIKYVVIDLMTRVPGEVGTCAAIVKQLDMYNNVVNAEDFTRAEAQDVKRIMGKTFAFCYGYATQFTDFVERYSKNKSLAAWAELESGDMIIGVNVGKWAKNVDKDTEVMLDMVKMVLGTMVGSLESMRDEFFDDEEEESVAGAGPGPGPAPAPAPAAEV